MKDNGIMIVEDQIKDFFCCEFSIQMELNRYYRVSDNKTKKKIEIYLF